MTGMKKLHCIYFTEEGRETAGKVCRAASERKFAADMTSGKGRLAEWTGNHFREDNILVFVGACGIAVRAIAPFVKDKKTDPAVIVIDSEGKYVIPILSGHIGGANDCARYLARELSAEAVITTATDERSLLAIDEFAKEYGLALSDMELAKRFAADIIASGRGMIKTEPDSEVNITKKLKKALELRGVILEDETESGEARQDRNKKGLNCGRDGKTAEAFIGPFKRPGKLLLITKNIILGVGCRRGTESGKLLSFVHEKLEECGVCEEAVGCIASIDIKKDEEALHALSRQYNAELTFYSSEELNNVSGSFSESDFVKKVTGTGNVCERAAAAAGAGRFILKKTAGDGVTLAVGIKSVMLDSCS